MRSRRGGSSGGGGSDPDGRQRIMLVLFGLAMVVVVGHLVWYQLVRGPELAVMAEKHRQNTIELPARRGTIYDRNGNVLAMSEDCTTVYCNPQEVKEPYLTAEVLATYLGGTSEDYVGTLQEEGTFSYVKRKVDREAADAIESELAKRELAGVYYLPDSRRIYPYGEIGGQVLGVVGIDGDGLTGLELYYDDILSGTNGEMIVEMGARGTPIAGAVSHTTNAQDGTDIIISLDINVQRVAEEQILLGVGEYKAQSGSVMVTNPKTGEVLAACSTPLLDASDTSVVEEGATNLKIVSDSYEPGSIVKILTTAIGLDAGVVDSSESFYVPAFLQVGDDIVCDDDGRMEDMYMTLREILRRSSNTGAALVAQEEIGADTFSEGLARFGIGELTGIDYPGETAGIVKTREEYDGSSVGSMSFGQGLAIPLVQMVRAAGALANGGMLLTPHFLVAKGVETVDWGEGVRVVSEDTSDQVVDMMRTVIKEGTGVKAQVEGYDIAGKTGTGEQADTEKGGYVEGHFTSSLLGFAQADDPTVLVYVGLNGTPYLAYSSAAPLFSSIMSEALTDMGVLPTVQSTGEGA